MEVSICQVLPVFELVLFVIEHATEVVADNATPMELLVEAKNMRRAFESSLPMSEVSVIIEAEVQSVLPACTAPSSESRTGPSAIGSSSTTQRLRESGDLRDESLMSDLTSGASFMRDNEAVAHETG